MKTFILILLLSFQTHTYANWVKKSSVKLPSIIWAEKSKCEKVEDEPCFDISKKDMRKFKMGRIDDLDSPKYLKKGSVACSDLPSCQSFLMNLDCSIFLDGSFAVMAEDFSEVYCAEPNGFNQKDGLVVDSIGSQAAIIADLSKVQEINDRATKMAARETALIQCAKADTLTAVQLKLCLQGLVKEVYRFKMDVNDL